MALIAKTISRAMLALQMSETIRFRSGQCFCIERTRDGNWRELVRQYLAEMEFTFALLEKTLEPSTGKPRSFRIYGRLQDHRQIMEETEKRRRVQ